MFLPRRRPAGRRLTHTSPPGRRPARPNPPGRRSSTVPPSPSAALRTSSPSVSTRSSPAAAATRSFSTTTGSRTCSTRGGRNFTAPHLGGKSPWTHVDSNLEANVFSTVLELPTSELGGSPGIRIWGRCSLRRDGQLLHVDRAGHPSVSSFFNTDETKQEYNASEPAGDRERWTDQFAHLMGHTGNYTREEAIAAIDAEGLLPDMLASTRHGPRSTPTAAPSPATPSTPR